MIKQNSITYLMVRPEKQEYMGERYFAFSWDSDKVIQVCFAQGDIKRGKSNNVGVYLINKLTLVSNYMAMNYLTPISRKTYTSKFNKVVEIMSLLTANDTKNKR